MIPFLILCDQDFVTGGTWWRSGIWGTLYATKKHLETFFSENSWQQAAGSACATQRETNLEINRYSCHTYKQMRVQTKHVRKGLYEQARPLNALPSWNTSSPLLRICAWRRWPLKFQGTSSGPVPDLANVANLFWICLVINYSHWTGRHVILLSFFGSKNKTGENLKGRHQCWTKNRGNDGNKILQECCPVSSV